VFARVSPEQSEIWLARADGKSWRRLTRPPVLVSDGEPTWSPDGRHVAFVRIDDRTDPGKQRIRVVDVDGGAAHPIGPNFADEPDWSPDGRRVAFTTASGCSIALMRADGTAVRMIPLPHLCAGAATWSPDGRRLAFAAGPRGNEPVSLFVVRPDGTGLHRLTFGPGNAGSPSWSASGRIAFTLTSPKGIYSIRPDGHGLRRMSRLERGSFDDSPSWSPNGRTLVFARESGSVYGELRVVGVDGTHARPFAPAQPLESPAVSPRGTTIAYVDPRFLRDRLAVLDLRSGRIRRLPTSGSEPAWTPNGKALAFTASYGQPREAWDAIFVLQDGRSRLLHSYAEDPAWSPNAKRLAYTRIEIEVAEIWVGDARARHARRLSPPHRQCRSPAWSPDALRLAFACKRGSSEDLWLTGFAGRGPHLLLRDAGEPAWSRDGKLITAVRGQSLITVDPRDGRSRIVVRRLGVVSRPTWLP
jgi:TolB protein